MKHIVIATLAGLALFSLACAWTAKPEQPMKSREDLQKISTHTVVAKTGKVYSTQEKKAGYLITHSIAELFVESVEKPEKGSGLDSETPIYVRWMSRVDQSRIPRAGGSGHYGKTPQGRTKGAGLPGPQFLRRLE